MNTSIELTLQVGNREMSRATAGPEDESTPRSVRPAFHFATQSACSLSVKTYVRQGIDAEAPWPLSV